MIAFLNSSPNLIASELNLLEQTETHILQARLQVLPPIQIILHYVKMCVDSSCINFSNSFFLCLNSSFTNLCRYH